MEAYTLRAHEAQIEFHKREIQEGPLRHPAMSEVQLMIHEQELEKHLGVLSGLAEVIYLPNHLPLEQAA